MSELNTQNNQRERIKQLLELLLDRDLKRTSADRIRKWFAQEEDRSLKDGAMEELFGQYISESKPGHEAVDDYRQLAEQLGLKTNQVRKPLMKRMVFRVAAVVVPLMIVAGAMLLIDRGGQSPVTIVETTQIAAVEDQYLMLPDSSEVWMKKGTELAFVTNFADDRKVQITGEAFFSVRKIDDKPFVVETKDVVVRVLGTKFNVKAYCDQTVSEGTLAEGRVEVTTKDNRSTVMDPMDQLIYDQINGELVVQPLTVDQVLDVRPDRLVFNNLPLGEVFKTIGQYYQVNMKIDKALPLDKVIRLNFADGESLQNVMSVIQVAYNEFDYEINQDGVVITRRH